MRSRFVIAGMATILERQEAAIGVIKAIAPQVKLMVITANDYTDQQALDLVSKFPLEIKSKLIINVPEQDMTDAGKFWGFGMAYDYYVTVDDDLIYPDTYVRDIVQESDRLHAPVSYHGYNLNTRQRFLNARFDKCHCLHDFPTGGVSNTEAQRDVIGTGVACFPAQSIQLDANDFIPMMADLNVAKAAMDQGVRMYVLAHSRGYLKHSAIVDKSRTIWSATAKDDSVQTKFIRSWTE